MATYYNRGKRRIAESGWPGLDVRLLVLADPDTLPAGANDPDLNTVADLLAVSGVTEAANISGAGYVRKTLAGKTVVEDDTANAANLDASDLVYGDTDAGRWVATVQYIEGASDAARDLISLNDLTSPLVTNGGPVTLTVDVGGLIGHGD